LDNIFTPTATRQSVRRQLGEPVGSSVYEPPRRLADVPELQALPIWGKDGNLEVVSVGYENYRYRGIIYDLGAHQEAGMVLGLTFGLWEVYMFPRSLKWASQEGKIENSFRVWYSTEGHCLAYCLWRPDNRQHGKILNE
jgi:hypothetical protein